MMDNLGSTMTDDQLITLMLGPDDTMARWAKHQFDKRHPEPPASTRTCCFEGCEQCQPQNAPRDGKLPPHLHDLVYAHAFFLTDPWIYTSYRLVGSGPEVEAYTCTVIHPESRTWYINLHDEKRDRLAAVTNGQSLLAVLKRWGIFVG